MLKALEPLEKRFGELTELLADPGVINNHNKYRELSKEHADLEEILIKGRQFRKIIKDIDDNREILKTSDDKELLELAESDLEELEDHYEKVRAELEMLLIPRDPDDDKNAIVEIRAGTGGEEAALFAADLYRMYSRYIENKEWKMDVMNTSATGIGGLKEIIFLVEGKGVFGDLKYESGVHRVQRVPQTEASGRIHTSAASVAVLPEAREVDIRIDPNDLKIDVFRSSGPGGQSVNTTDSAVRITHIPSGMVVTCQDEKSQLKNKNKAMKVLRARLLDKAVREQNSEQARRRKTQVGTGDRSEKIRTYNFPQNRVTDHRFGLTLYDLENIINGDISALILEAKKTVHREPLNAKN
ncbi:MAG: peptide chain release factor 1 [Candidatus Zixiibacteriota bacterium]|nr:MAG: peptide chain release factor 1 [candidate division Zixibacteria bacterium]